MNQAAKDVYNIGYQTQPLTVKPVTADTGIQTPALNGLDICLRSQMFCSWITFIWSLKITDSDFPYSRQMPVVPINCLHVYFHCLMQIIQNCIYNTLTDSKTALENILFNNPDSYCNDNNNTTFVILLIVSVVHAFLECLLIFRQSIKTMHTTYSPQLQSSPKRTWLQN